MPLISGRQALPFDPRLVGERFEQEREMLGLSRADLAATCEYSAEQVRRVEKGEQAPGARLLAALAEAGGDLRVVLLNAGERHQINEAEALYLAQYRDDIRREAREWSKLKSDRLKKRLDEDEADLVDLFRHLSTIEKKKLLRLVELMAEGKASIPTEDPPGTVIRASGSSIAAAGNVTIGRKSDKRR